MSESWAYQLSLKLDGQHLLNLRADDAVAFKDMLAWATENREPILAAVAALSPVPAPAARPAVAPRQATIGPQRGSGGELGPLVLEKVEVKLAGKDGVPFRGPLYAVRYEGSSATTFDKLIGQAALGFWQAGAPCYVTVEPSAKNPKFSNLVSIRSAVAS